ncbi:hypothetical protein [Egicoccus halophilus]|uniref:Uncharacterized protein n=1 Tax=Egicoccus halophilus TaxID=1670830 RepID=A0A8J3A8W2_9ACTN|nr:hypothetical protein [Egicoccus halophilus]GGI04801.1 hypothetical protein GCM10011354_10910 [Egicoccus halophilus]
MGRRRLLLVVTLLIGMVGSVGTGASASTAARGSFSWNDPDPALVTASVAAGRDELWVHVRPGTVRSGGLRATAAAGQRAGVRVAALGGDPNWADRGRAAALAWVSEVAAADGVDHVVLDIEPYLLPEWSRSASSQRKLVDRFVGTLAEAKKRAGSDQLTVAIPFWFDEIPASTGRGTLLDQVAAVADGLLVMAYRDTPQAQVQLVGEERRVAAATGTRLWVALELTAQDPAYISYHGRPRAEVDRAVAHLESALGEDRMFAGTVLHTLEAYQAMR